MIDVRVQAADFDPGAELAALGPAGAVASFIGSVRADDGVAALEIEHYPEMTEATLRRIAGLGAEQWPVSALTVIHRVGRLAVGDHIVLVAAASPHRAAAIACMGFVIDRLKVAAPFWKKEHRADGSSRWIEARHDDIEAAARWSQAPARRAT